MRLEMESGGNIRYEEGKPSVSWHKSCVQFVQRHFSLADLSEDVRVRGVAVKSVTKVHNRFLRNRYETTVRLAAVSFCSAVFVGCTMLIM